MICSSSKQMISSLYLYFNIIIIVTKQSFPSDMIITTHDHRLWFGFIIMNTAYHVFDMFCACAVTKYRYRYSIPSILRPKVLGIGIEMKFVVSPTTTSSTMIRRPKIIARELYCFRLFAVPPVRP